MGYSHSICSHQAIATDAFAQHRPAVSAPPDNVWESAKTVEQYIEINYQISACCVPQAFENSVEALSSQLQHHLELNADTEYSICENCAR